MKIAALEFIATIKYNVGEPLPKEAAEISYMPPPFLCPDNVHL